ncbi:hypothetical protein [Parapedomonas caeni]
MTRTFGLSLAITLIAGTAGAAPHGFEAFVKQYDSNGDGIVSPLEFQQERDASFKETDTNRDGVISETEYVAEFTKRLDENMKRMRETQLKQAHIRFESIDSNADKRMSRDEYLASGWRMYGSHDSNSNGKLSGAGENSAVTANQPPAKK